MSFSTVADSAQRRRILLLEPEGYPVPAREVLTSLGDLTEGPMSRHELLEKIAKVEVLLVRLAHQIDDEVLEAGRNLKVIVSATTGLDHIDLKAAGSRQIRVLSLRGEREFLSTITATAEHTWALLLALVRRIPEATDCVAEGHWDRDRLKGHDLAGKRLGIVGLGRLGRQVAAYGAAFRMPVAAYDPWVQDWPQEVRRHQTLAALLAESEILSIHVDLNPGTLNLIGAKELAALPRGAIVVNTSRGQVVESAALLEALERGHLGGAALDVLADERVPVLRNANPLLGYAKRHRNLLITPHIGGATYEAMANAEIFMAHRLAESLLAINA